MNKLLDHFEIRNFPNFKYMFAFWLLKISTAAKKQTNKQTKTEAEKILTKVFKKNINFSIKLKT